jgi:hypothetical protein
VQTEIESSAGNAPEKRSLKYGGKDLPLESLMSQDQKFMDSGNPISV